MRMKGLESSFRSAFLRIVDTFGTISFENMNRFNINIHNAM